MLTYLSMSSQPDIVFAVHQCPRFSTCPMRIHEITIHCICHYLQATTDKGYILQPTPNYRNLDCYVDADFASLWTEASSSESTPLNHVLALSSSLQIVLSFGSPSFKLRWPLVQPRQNISLFPRPCVILFQ